jgi:hypothetical protein
MLKTSILFPAKEGKYLGASLRITLTTVLFFHFLRGVGVLCFGGNSPSKSETLACEATYPDV